MFSGGKVGGGRVCWNKGEFYVSSLKDYNFDGVADRLLKTTCYEKENKSVPMVSYYMQLSAPDGQFVEESATFSMDEPDVLKFNFFDAKSFHKLDRVSVKGIKEEGNKTCRIDRFVMAVKKDTGDLINSYAELSGGLSCVTSPLSDLTLLTPATELLKTADKLVKNLSNDVGFKKLIARRIEILSYALPQNLLEKPKKNLDFINRSMGEQINTKIAEEHLDEVGAKFVRERVVKKIGEVSGGGL